MCWESSGVVRFDLRPLLQGQMRIAKLKSAYNSLIIGPRGFGALSLRWIQFASVLRCARSSSLLFYPRNTPRLYHSRLGELIVADIGVSGMQLCVWDLFTHYCTHSNTSMLSK